MFVVVSAEQQVTLYSRLATAGVSAKDVPSPKTEGLQAFGLARLPPAGMKKGGAVVLQPATRGLSGCFVVPLVSH